MVPPTTDASGGTVVIDINTGAENDTTKDDSKSKRQAMAAGVSWGTGPAPFIYIVHLLGVVAAVLVLVWSISYRGGLSWNASNKNLVFNIHPVLMVIGFIFLSSEAILIYKSVPGSKQYKKKIHLVLQGIALVIALVGTSAAFKYHNDLNIDNLYSLHSWLGLGTLILFFLQWFVGLVTFWFPGAGAARRKSVLPWHVFVGIFTYVLAIATAQTGVLEKVTFLQSAKVFGHYATEAYIANCTALAVLLLGVFTVLGAVIPKPPLEDEYSALE